MASLPADQLGGGTLSEQRKQNVVERLLGVRERYGKVGLLIDDAPEAGSRVARDLYGSERLPDWWLHARSVQCGAFAVDAFAEAFASPSGNHGAHGLVLIDRFLPETDERARPTAWDLPQAGNNPAYEDIKRDMKRAVRRLKSLADGQGGLRYFDYDLITSYPHVPLAPSGDAGAEEPFAWQTRSSEVLYQRRRKLHPSLRTYGPEKSARADADPAKWKAKTWSASIQALAKALMRQSEDTPVVLFTGAGASLAEGTYGAGMPPTWWLLEETCRRYVHDEDGGGTGRLKERTGAAPSRELRLSCLHEALPGAGGSASIPLTKAGAPIDQLIDYLLRDEARSAKDLELPLEAIFSHELNQGPRDIRKFHEHFRSLLEYFDHGFAYHHWLLAQMPWTWIITTNFDSCHERAAFAAASSYLGPDAEIRKQRLSLGSVFPDLGLEKRGSRKTFEQLAKSFRLFKPYGNLLSPAQIALSERKLLDFSKRLKPTFHGLERARHGWLVVVGHAMKDNHIDEVLLQLSRTKSFVNRFELLWIVPDAYERCANPRSTWEKWIDEKRQRRLAASDAEDPEDQFSGPLPATALDFAYDLFTAYRAASQLAD